MGEIADMIINGDFDQYTGEYIGPGDGYPRSLEDNRDYSRKNKVNGIEKFLHKFLTATKARKVIKEYCVEILDRDKNESHTKKCSAISKDFNPFRIWINKNYRNGHS